MVGSRGWWGLGMVRGGGWVEGGGVQGWVGRGGRGPGVVR